MGLETLWSMPLPPAFDRPMAGALPQDTELAAIDQDIAEEEEHISHQAALIALLEADGQCTILADAQLGAMEQCLSALRGAPWAHTRRLSGRANFVDHAPAVWATVDPIGTDRGTLRLVPFLWREER